MPVRLVIFLAALALTACGSAGAPVKTSSRKLAISLDEFTIRPQQLSIPGGRKLTVTVTNRGRLGHTFRIRTTTRNVLALTTIEPGESKSKTFRLRPGTYTMYCVLANHEELGMNGRLTVR